MVRPLAGRTIALLEARRSDEVARLIQIQGGRPLVAPALREVPVEDDRQIRDWLGRMTDGQFEVVVFLTGVGCRALLERAEGYGLLPKVLQALAAARVVARGPKPVKVLNDKAVRIDFVPPEPNTSDELLAEFGRWQLAGKTMGLQIYGGTTPFLERLREGLAATGVRVWEAAPYRWEGPADSEPVQTLIENCIAGNVDAIAFFSSSQVHNLFALAEDAGLEVALAQALSRPNLLVAAVGPVCAEAVTQHGLRVDVQPEHPKMGHLVLALAEAFASQAPTPGPSPKLGGGERGEGQPRL